MVLPKGYRFSDVFGVTGPVVSSAGLAGNSTGDVAVSFVDCTVASVEKCNSMIKVLGSQRM